MNQAVLFSKVIGTCKGRCNFIVAVFFKTNTPPSYYPNSGYVKTRLFNRPAGSSHVVGGNRRKQAHIAGTIKPKLPHWYLSATASTRPSSLARELCAPPDVHIGGRD